MAILAWKGEAMRWRPHKLQGRCLPQLPSFKKKSWNLEKRRMRSWRAGGWRSECQLFGQRKVCHSPGAAGQSPSIIALQEAYTVAPNAIAGGVQGYSLMATVKSHDDKSLRKVALFRDLPDKSLALVERRCSWRRFRAGEQIISYQDASRDVHFMISGQARVIIYSIDGKAVAFRDIGAGDFFGEFAAIDERPRSASVEAKTDCLVASISPRSFREVLAEEPRVALPLITHLVAQIRLLTDRVFEFSTLAVNNRIHAELLRLARQADPSSNQVCLSPAPTHAEIASRISTHREAVSRELSRLAQIGLIQRQNSSLLIKDVERLVGMVREATGE